MTESEPRWAIVDEFLVNALVDEDEALAAARATGRAAGLPAIEVAPNQGKLLYLFARTLGASSILELGTLAGYSTIWLARALSPGGTVVTLEAVPEHAAVALANFERAGVADRVEVLVGPALETLATLRDRQPFDFVFIDADKPNNPQYVDHAITLTRPGGLIVVDNVVRGGAIVDMDSDDPSVMGTRTCLERMGADPRIESTAIQTVGSKGWDGFAIARVR